MLKINRQRPTLKDVSISTSDDVLIFAFLNMVIGIGLYSEMARALDFFIINPVFTNTFWGITFFGAGAGLLIAYLLNRWRLIKSLLLFCLFLKAIWITALSVRQFESLNTNIFLVLFFATLGVKQIFTYLRFPRIAEWKK